MGKEATEKDEKTINVNCKIEHDFNFSDDAEYMPPNDGETPPEVRIVPDYGRQKIDDFFAYDIDRAFCVAIPGERGSGKTALVYEMFDHYRGRKDMYIYNHPNPKRVERIRTANKRQIFTIDDFNKVAWMERILIYIDEPQLYFPQVKDLLLFLSVVRHKDITLIFTSVDTRWFQAKVEAMMDVWLIKDIDIDIVKRQSKILKILQRRQQFSNDLSKFRLAQNELIYASRRIPEYNEPGYYKNGIPTWFDDSLSKPFSGKKMPEKEISSNNTYVIWDN